MSKEPQQSPSADSQFRADDPEMMARVHRVLDPHSNPALEAFHQSEWEEDMGDKLRLKHEVTHDELTGLLNLRGLKERLGETQKPRSVVFLDATNFKEVNDELGHNRGDEVITDMAKMIRECFRPEDIVARIGGDEFFVVLDEAPRKKHAEIHSTSEEDAELTREVARKRVANNAYRYLDENPDLQQLHLRIAFGGTTWRVGETLDAVKERADRLMQADKHEQHGEYQYRRPKHET
jgi:diguanylate cyclase (GGDEF)-like protein